MKFQEGDKVKYIGDKKNTPYVVVSVPPKSNWSCMIAPLFIDDKGEITGCDFIERCNMLEKLKEG